MQIIIDQQQRELKLHGSEEYPILISNEVLSGYDKGYFLSHWHTEIEFTYVIEGEILYTAGGSEYLLKKGQGMYCNQNVPHSGKMHRRQDCHYLSLTFLPKLIYGFEQSRIKTKYIDSIVKNPLFTHLPLLENQEETADILRLLAKIHTLTLQKEEINELNLLSLLSSVWMRLYDCFDLANKDAPQSPHSEKDLDRLRKILELIHLRYDSKLTLQEIAASVSLCSSECCRFFKKQMNRTIHQYLLDYRIEKSLELLKNTDCSITELAHNTGFSSASYYTKLFHRQMGITPLQYRNGNKKQTAGKGV